MIAERSFTLSTVSPRQRVLVIEDDKKMAKSLREGFDERGYDVQVASSGEEGSLLSSVFVPTCSSSISTCRDAAAWKFLGSFESRR